MISKYLAIKSWAASSNGCLVNCQHWTENHLILYLQMHIAVFKNLPDQFSKYWSLQFVVDALITLYALLYGTLISKKYNPINFYQQLLPTTFTNNYCCSKHTKTLLIQNFLLK